MLSRSEIIKAKSDMLQFHVKQWYARHLSKTTTKVK